MVGRLCQAVAMRGTENQKTPLDTPLTGNHRCVVYVTTGNHWCVVYVTPSILWQLALALQLELQ